MYSIVEGKGTKGPSGKRSVQHFSTVKLMHLRDLKNVMLCNMMDKGVGVPLADTELLLLPVF